MHDTKPSYLNRFYTVLPGQGRTPGIYDDWDAAERQILGYSKGRAKRFATLPLAVDYWRKNAPGIEPALFVASESDETLMPPKQQAVPRCTVTVVRDDGERFQRTLEGDLATRIVHFVRGGV